MIEVIRFSEELEKIGRRLFGYFSGPFRTANTEGFSLYFRFGPLAVSRFYTARELSDPRVLLRIHDEFKAAMDEHCQEYRRVEWDVKRCHSCGGPSHDSRRVCDWCGALFEEMKA